MSSWYLLCNIILDNGYGNNPYVYFDQWDTPISVLNLAALTDQLEIVEYVIDRVENKIPVIPTTPGYTILHMLAEQKGHVETVELILSRLEKENRNPYNEQGFSPAHLAARNNNLELLKLFLADLEDKNPPINMLTKRTLIHLTAIGGYIRILDYLANFVDDLNPGTFVCFSCIFLP